MEPSGRTIMGLGGLLKPLQNSKLFKKQESLTFPLKNANIIHGLKGGKKMPSTRKEFRQLNKFKRIYILASGGRDSTYTILKLMEFQYWITKPVTISFTDTGNETTSALVTLEKLFQAITASSMENHISTKGLS